METNKFLETGIVPEGRIMKCAALIGRSTTSQWGNTKIRYPSDATMDHEGNCLTPLGYKGRYLTCRTIGHLPSRHAPASSCAGETASQSRDDQVHHLVLLPGPSSGTTLTFHVPFNWIFITNDDSVLESALSRLGRRARTPTWPIRTRQMASATSTSNFISIFCSWKLDWTTDDRCMVMHPPTVKLVALHILYHLNQLDTDQSNKAGVIDYVDPFHRLNVINTFRFLKLIIYKTL